ncbi:MAG: GGDEF domain-containing protein [Planctomycetes bacterium]|nr:GGDEF domain-containing protein [Planctomycetota bacterium]
MHERLTRDFQCDGDAVSQLLQEVRSGVRQTAVAFELELDDPKRLAERQIQTGQLLTQFAMGMAARIEPLESRQQTLEQLATTDGLTGIANRRTLDLQFRALYDAARGAGRTLALLMIDLDLFKRVNDEHGHQAGDELLQALGAVLRANASDGEFAARYGGEEFCVLIPDADESRVRDRAELLRCAIAAIRVPLAGGVTLAATASIGAALAADVA